MFFSLKKNSKTKPDRPTKKMKSNPTRPLTLLTPIQEHNICQSFFSLLADQRSCALMMDNLLDSSSMNEWIEALFESLVCNKIANNTSFDLRDNLILPADFIQLSKVLCLANRKGLHLTLIYKKYHGGSAAFDSNDVIQPEYIFKIIEKAFNDLDFNETTKKSFPYSSP